jgi:hypothetical protein
MRFVKLIHDDHEGNGGPREPFVLSVGDKVCEDVQGDKCEIDDLRISVSAPSPFRVVLHHGSTTDVPIDELWFGSVFLSPNVLVDEVSHWIGEKVHFLHINSMKLKMRIAKEQGLHLIVLWPTETTAGATKISIAGNATQGWNAMPIKLNGKTVLQPDGAQDLGRVAQFMSAGADFAKLKSVAHRAVAARKPSATTKSKAKSVPKKPVTKTVKGPTAAAGKYVRPKKVVVPTKKASTAKKPAGKKVLKAKKGKLGKLKVLPIRFNRALSPSLPRMCLRTRVHFMSVVRKVFARGRLMRGWLR